jgi:hypothetical protein
VILYTKLLFHRAFSPARGNEILTRSRVFLALSVLALLVLPGVLLAQSSLLSLPEPSATEILAQRSIADSTDQERATNPPSETVLQTQPPPEAKAPKSSGKAFLYNLILPGTGHLYAGYKRGWAHLGVEGLTWFTYFYYHERGLTKEDEFEAFADGHYNLAKYDSVCACEGTDEYETIHRFYETNKQHYYEDIGKLPNYFSGWDDWDQNTGTSPPYGDSANRHFYRGVRSDSNNFLKNARYALVVGFVNRVVSAVDVLRLTKKEKTQVALGEDTILHFKARAKPFNSENAVGVRIVHRY